MTEHLRCGERDFFSRKLIRASRAVIEAKADLDRAIRDLKPVDPFVEALAAALDAEHEAVRLLAVHRKEHGC